MRCFSHEQPVNLHWPCPQFPPCHTGLAKRPNTHHGGISPRLLVGSRLPADHDRIPCTTSHSGGLHQCFRAPLHCTALARSRSLDNPASRLRTVSSRVSLPPASFYHSAAVICFGLFITRLAAYALLRVVGAVSPLLITSWLLPEVGLVLIEHRLMSVSFWVDTRLHALACNISRPLVRARLLCIRRLIRTLRAILRAHQHVTARGLRLVALLVSRTLVWRRPATLAALAVLCSPTDFVPRCSAAAILASAVLGLHILGWKCRLICFLFTYNLVPVTGYHQLLWALSADLDPLRHLVT